MGAGLVGHHPTRWGSKAEYGADACEFAPLGPGRYFIEPVGLEASPGQPLRAEINLDANRVGWVRFAKTAAPVAPMSRRRRSNRPSAARLPAALRAAWDARSS